MFHSPEGKSYLQSKLRSEKDEATKACISQILQSPDSSKASSPLSTVHDFYTQYLNYNYHKTPNLPIPKIEFSRSFTHELKINADLCTKYADGPCGFGADGDPYTNSQDSDENLDAKKAKLQVVELEKGLIQVKFKLFPVTDNTFTVINYKMIKENGQWVVDDITYSSNQSARKQLKEENEYNIKYGPENVRIRAQQKKR